MALFLTGNFSVGFTQSYASHYSGDGFSDGAQLTYSNNFSGFFIGGPLARLDDECLFFTILVA